MKEDTFSLVSSLEANYLNIRLKEPVRLDQIAVHVIKEDCPEFLIPFRIVNINDAVTLKYKLINTVALEYSDKSLSKTAFVRLYLNLLTPFMKGKDWFLDYHYFCIDARYIFLEKQSNIATFVYVPEKSYHNSDENILHFFQETFTNITILDDANFQVKLYRYFSGKEINLSDLYQLLLQEVHNTGGAGAAPYCPSVRSAAVSGRSTLQEEALDIQEEAKNGQERKLPFQKPGKQVMEGKAEHKALKEEAAIPGPDRQAGISGGSLLDSEGAGDDAVMEALFGSGKKKKEKAARQSVKERTEKAKPEKKKESVFHLFGKKQEISPKPQMASKAEPREYPLPAPAYFVPVEESGEQTEIYEGGDSSTAACLELVESPIPGAVPRIPLDFTKPFIILGRTSSDEVQPDITFGREFSHIGRRHARIEKKDGNYYVIDLGSANHTLLNDQVLIPNQAYRLTDGSLLTLTNSRPVRYRIRL